MSYFVSEDMQLEDFDVIIEALDDFICKMECAIEEPEEEYYEAYATEAYKKTMFSFCDKITAQAAELKALAEKFYSNN